MALKVLCDRILEEGRCMEGSVLRVDRFVNHQMDPYLMKQAAIEFIRRFADVKVNKILTIESSGIAPAVMLGYLMELPVVFVKKKPGVAHPHLAICCPKFQSVTICHGFISFFYQPVFASDSSTFTSGENIY